MMDTVRLTAERPRLPYQVPTNLKRPISCWICGSSECVCLFALVPVRELSFHLVILRCLPAYTYSCWAYKCQIEMSSLCPWQWVINIDSKSQHYNRMTAMRVTVCHIPSVLCPQTIKINWDGLGYYSMRTGHELIAGLFLQVLNMLLSPIKYFQTCR